MSLQGLPTELLLNVRDFIPSICNLALTSRDINSALGGRDACIEHLLRRAFHSRDTETQLHRYWQTAPLSLRSFFVYLPQVSDERLHDQLHALCMKTFHLSYPKTSKAALHKSLTSSAEDDQKFATMANERCRGSFEAGVIRLLCGNYIQIHPSSFNRVSDERLISRLEILSKHTLLTHLTISDPSLLTKAGIEQLNQFPTIRSLYVAAPLPDGVTLSYIEHFFIEQANGQLPSLPNLTRLSIAKSPNLKIIQCPVSSLEELCIDGSGNDWVIVGTSDKPVEIEVLTVSNCGKKFPPINHSHIIVEELGIRSCPEITDVFLTQNGNARITRSITVRDCPELECCSIWNNHITKLSIERCCKLDEYALVCKELTSFRVIECAAFPIFSAALQNVKLFMATQIIGKPGSYEEVEFPASLENCALDKCNNLKSITTQGDKLVNLSLDDCPLLDTLKVPSLNLKRIELMDLPIRAIKSDRKMKAVDLDRIPRPYVELSSSVIETIVLKLKDLDYLDLSKCTNDIELIKHEDCKPTIIKNPIAHHAR